MGASETTFAIMTLQGFFVPYLTGAIVLVVLAVGSTAPGLLQFVIGRFAQVFPDYRERVLRHEAAHFLVRLMPHPHIVLAAFDIVRSLRPVIRVSW